MARWSINIGCKDKGERAVREEGNRPIGVMMMWMCCVLEGRDGRKKGANKGSY